MIELIGLIIKHIILVIVRFFKWIWKVGKAAGISVTLLILLLIVIYPIYHSTIEEKVQTMHEFEIKGVKQVEGDEHTSRLIVTVENKSSTPINRSPYLGLIIEDRNYYLQKVGYYSELEDNFVRLYQDRCLPAGTQAEFLYEFDTYNLPSNISEMAAIIFINEYSSEKGGEYGFTFISN